MRHFLLLAPAPGALARRVFQRPAIALLVSLRGAAPGFAPANLRTRFSAVTVATVAQPADAYLPGTTPTAIQPIALFDGPHEPCTWHWTTPRIAGIKALQTCLYKRVPAEGPGFFQEFVRAFVYPASRRENSAHALSTYAAPHAHIASLNSTTDNRLFRCAVSHACINPKTFARSHQAMNVFEGAAR